MTSPAADRVRTDRAPPPRSRRRDAEARREALLRAAANCFETSGFNVPLEDVAARAGVGRGTLYRNFKDRMALAFAIFEREVERLEAELDRNLPIDRMLTTLVRDGLSTSHLFTRLLIDMPLTGEDLATFRGLGPRLERLFAPAVERARAAGEIRGDVEPRHVLLALRMMSGVIVHQKQADAAVEEQIAEALAFVMRALRP